MLALWTLLAIVLAVSAGSSTDCASQADDGSRTGCEVGTGLGVAVIGGVWFAGVIVIAVVLSIFAMSRRDR